MILDYNEVTISATILNFRILFFQNCGDVGGSDIDNDDDSNNDGDGDASLGDSDEIHWHSTLS